MERSRLTYEVTNQQLMAVITKLSSQLARAKLPPPPPPQQQQLGSKPSTIVTPAAASPAVSEAPSSSSSSFRRQKGIRMKKRDSVRRSPGLVGDSQSCTSSDSGNYSDNNTDTSLQAADGHNNNNSSNNIPLTPRMVGFSSSDLRLPPAAMLMSLSGKKSNSALSIPWTPVQASPYQNVPQVTKKRISRDVVF